MEKFSDDVDLITTLDNYDKIEDEVEHVDRWANSNNLILNEDEPREIIFRSIKSVQVIRSPDNGWHYESQSFKKLGVIFQDKLIIESHVDAILAKCASIIYALNLLRNHGLNQDGLQRVFQAKVVFRLTFASSSWCGTWLVMRNIDELTHFLKFEERSRTRRHIRRHNYFNFQWYLNSNFCL